MKECRSGKKTNLRLQAAAVRHDAEVARLQAETEASALLKGSMVNGAFLVIRSTRRRPEIDCDCLPAELLKARRHLSSAQPSALLVERAYGPLGHTRTHPSPDHPDPPLRRGTGSLPAAKYLLRDDADVYLSSQLPYR
eukprot:scaffold118322_cov32-Tisochrysis_lutea.AAC.1